MWGFRVNDKIPLSQVRVLYLSLELLLTCSCTPLVPQCALPIVPNVTPLTLSTQYDPLPPLSPPPRAAAPGRRTHPLRNAKHGIQRVLGVP